MEGKQKRVEGQKIEKKKNASTADTAATDDKPKKALGISQRTIGDVEAMVTECSIREGNDLLGITLLNASK